MPRGVLVLPSPEPTDAAHLLPALQAALTGRGPALLPLAPGAPGRAALAAAALTDPVAPDVALMLATSGSTGSPKVVELDAAALTAGARAAAERLGGPGAWLLALPLEHVAGWQVLVRGLLAGHEPVVVPPGDLTGLPEAVERLRGRGAARCYTSLVPTQLVRALADPQQSAALARLDAVLVGGAATAPVLVAAARAAGIAVVTTYGSTETAGGCVYDGEPLRGARVEVDDEGRILLGGATLARGYRGGLRGGFLDRGGERWFATDDAGELDAGRLRVVGRRDDVLTTGGRKVAPAAVEAVLAEVPSLAATVVVGVADPEWGQRVVALGVVHPGTAPPALPEVRALVTARLGSAAAPTALLLVDHLPLRGIGKVDRAAAVALAGTLLRPGGAHPLTD